MRFKPFAPSDRKRWPLSQVVEVEGYMELDFENRQKQRFKLLGALFRPSLEVSWGKHHFGTVHTSRSMPKELLLTNRSYMVRKA